MLCFHQLRPRGERYHLKETEDLGTGRPDPRNAGAMLCEQVELEGPGNDLMQKGVNPGQAERSEEEELIEPYQEGPCADSSFMGIINYK